MTGGVGSLIASISTMSTSDDSTASGGVRGAPNEAALLSLLERTNYSMIQENGQRKYGGPPPGWVGAPPPRGCEIFVGKIPRDCYEDELVPIFEKIGYIYELRLMMDFSGSNRGYAFVMYTSKHDAQRAVREMNNYEIRKGRLLGVCASVDNCRLFVGGIPKNKTKEEIHVEMNKVTEGVVDVIAYPSATDKTKNRGFAFVEYESHRSAAMARRKLIPGKIQLWGHQIAVDWAEPEAEVDEEVMMGVKILYVRNLMLTTTEEALEKVFNQAAGREKAVERVKKIRDYAFVHFLEREEACRAMHSMNGANLDGSVIEVVLAKPVDKNDYVRFTRSQGASGAVTKAGGPIVACEQPILPDAAALNAFYAQHGLQLPVPPIYAPGAGSRISGGRGGAPSRTHLRSSRGRATAAGLHPARGHYSHQRAALHRSPNEFTASSLVYPAVATAAAAGLTPTKLCRPDDIRGNPHEYVLMALGYPYDEECDRICDSSDSFEGLDLSAQLAATTYHGQPLLGPPFPAFAHHGNSLADLGLAYMPSLPFMTTAVLGAPAGKLPGVGELVYDLGQAAAAYPILPPQFQYT